MKKLLELVPDYINEIFHVVKTLLTTHRPPPKGRSRLDQRFFQFAVV